VLTECTGSSDAVIRDRNGRLGLRLDPNTGLLNALLFRHAGGEISISIELTATLVTGGDEVFVPPVASATRTPRSWAHSAT
jgi:hypothetical protein